MRKVISKSVIARDFIFESKCMFGTGHRPAPLVELERSPRHTSHSGCHGRGHPPAAVRVLCGEEGGRVVVRGRGGDE